MNYEGTTISSSWTEESATFHIPGLEKNLRLLHLTDTHVTVTGPQDEPFLTYSSRMDQAYSKNRRYDTGETATPVQCFDDALKLAWDSRADVIVLTGDIVNNPSATSVKAVKQRLEACGIDYIYLAGNHDWHYEGMEGSSDTLRERWRIDRLLPLYSTDAARKNPDIFSVSIGGILFVCLDNSTYQVNERQLEEFRRAADSQLPMVLLMHIPLAVESMENMLFGHPDWGAGVDKNYEIERRPRWPETGNTATTIDFVGAIAGAPNLVAILSGHTHLPRVDRIAPKLFPESAHPSAMQFVTRAGAYGGYRLVDFACEAAL